MAFSVFLFLSILCGCKRDKNSYTYMSFLILLFHYFVVCSDDLHMWLAPFLPYNNHNIVMSFSTVNRLSMIRIWVRPMNSIKTN